MSATGFAILSFGRIEIATVSPRRRGALVNWLVTSGRIPIYAWTSDTEIESLWRTTRGDHECLEVQITPLSLSSTEGK